MADKPDGLRRVSVYLTPEQEERLLLMARTQRRTKSKLVQVILDQIMPALPETKND